MGEEHPHDRVDWGFLSRFSWSKCPHSVWSTWSVSRNHLIPGQIRWIGVLPSDYNLLVEEEDQFAPLTEEDRRKIHSLQKRESVLRSPNLLRELELMEAADKKAEIQG